ncbi:MAG: RluA family pseudouridine synthase [Candidatus Competibacterales bacterium]
MAETDTPRARVVEVDPEHHGQRVDNFLQRTLKGVPKSRIYRILRKGEVRVNKGRIPPHHKLCAGDLVRIPPLRQGEDPGVHPPEAMVQRLLQRVVFEDEHWLVLAKPAGLAVHAGSGLPFGVIEALRTRRSGYLELGHRLDRDTSGCLLLAKSAAALHDFQRALAAREVEKRYLTLVRGCVVRPVAVDAPLRKNVLRGGERLVQVDPTGRAAHTALVPVATYPGATLVEATIATGRTHQIRVHATHAGHPVAGDAKYGDPAFNRQLAERGLKRLFLHAHALSFPAKNRELSISAPLDDDLTPVLDALEADP